MNHPVFLEASIARLNEFFSQQEHTEKTIFPDYVETVAAELPEEVSQSLLELAQTAISLRSSDSAPSEEGWATFAFQCGELYTQLKNHRQIQMELESVVVGPDRVDVQPLQPGQTDLLSRFVETRDRIFRKVADVTLKFLLIGLAILTLGLIFGLL